MIPNDTFARMRLYPHWHLKFIVAIVSLALTLALLIWSLLNYQPVHNFYGPRAIYSLVLLSVLLALLGRFLLLRIFKTEIAEAQQERQPSRLLTTWRPLFLLDITAPVYLAAGVLIDIPAAIITAIITQLALQCYTLLRGYVSWMEASYRLATTALLVFVADALYNWIAGPVHIAAVVNLEVNHIAETREFLGSILAALVMLLLLVLASFPIVAQGRHHDLRSVWREYLRSPVPVFQILVLSVGPLLPVVDTFDDAAAELAWLFFLVPLFAIYYLALVSTKLSIRTGELQHTLKDLSSARRRQDELRDYASLVTRVQEEERRRLARELHDDTAQALIALSLGLSGLERAMGSSNLPEKDVLWLSNLQNLADSTLEGVRRACRDLRPSLLDDLGLRAALEWLSDSSASRGIPCAFTCIGQIQSTTPEAEIAIFRIVQEALSNVWKHSHATQIALTLHYRTHLLEVTIDDNGQGFAVSQEQSTSDQQLQHGLGMLGMRERALLIGAQLSISSQPGKGCAVFLSLPLHA